MVVDGGQYLAGRFAGRVGRPREAGRHSGSLDIAEVVAADPEVIAIMPCGFDIEQVCARLPALVGWAEWQQFFAVRSGRVVMTEGNQYFNRSEPPLVESAEIRAECPHPGMLRLRAPRSRMEILGRVRRLIRGEPAK
ncbi:MAG: hypothetical protein OXG44_16710 [Gammaproteobacteria bacterium]|nr:hypothetical protein [Gammaproteobacteria bacterium]